MMGRSSASGGISGSASGGASGDASDSMNGNANGGAHDGVDRSANGNASGGARDGVSGGARDVVSGGARDGVSGGISGGANELDTAKKKGNLLEVYNLKKHFTIIGQRLFEKNTVKAVDDVSFTIKQGETLGLVGESGCGKTTAGRTLLRLIEPTSGRIVYDNETLFDSGGLPIFDKQGKPLKDANGNDALSDKISAKMLPYRRRMQIVFQDPYASLDPRMTVGDIVGEGIDIHKLAGSKQDRRDRIVKILEQVGLNTEHANRYPHEFSGGQRQRVGIARALAVDPELIVCDEPVSALDVSIQAQVINMLEDLQREMGLTYLFIAHDVSVVKHISNRIGVMYLGKMAELADCYELVFHSQHPYTKSLISAIPIADPEISRSARRIVLEGDVPSPVNPPSGCRFRTRCFKAEGKCAEEEPELREISPNHYAACHYV